MGIVEEAKQSVKQKHKEANAVKNKAIIETLKTIVITALITAIVAFTLGVLYQKSVTSDVQKQVKELSVVNTQAQPQSKK